MKHTEEEIARAAQRFGQLVEQLDPEKTPAEDIDDLREVAEAADAVATHQARLNEAVQRARARGRSWNRIAIALGVSRQAARQRYGTKADANAIRKWARSGGARSAVTGRYVKDRSRQDA